MFALNRRAKEKRDRRNRFRRMGFASAVSDEIDDIYDLKARFLYAVVAAGLHDEVVTWRRRQPTGWTKCPQCGDEWMGQTTFCDECGDFTGKPIQSRRRWYLVRVRGFAFHLPAGASGGSSVVRTAAVRAPDGGHDPDQPAREIPALGLTIEAQHRCVEMAIDRLVGTAMKKVS